MRLACLKCHGRKTDGSGHLCTLCYGTGEAPEKIVERELVAVKSPLPRPSGLKSL
jgi:hypothetical protein